MVKGYGLLCSYPVAELTARDALIERLGILTMAKS
jgi:hypothetical protein